MLQEFDEQSPRHEPENDSILEGSQLQTEVISPGAQRDYIDRLPPPVPPLIQGMLIFFVFMAYNSYGDSK